MYQLSACADTVFLKLPFEQCVKRITDAGLLVEFWGWKGRDLSQLEQVQVAGFSATQNGSLMHPEDTDLYVAGAAESTAAASRIHAPALIALMAGGEAMASLEAELAELTA
jgi:hydroxypyruvate isomerase